MYNPKAAQSVAYNIMWEDKCLRLKLNQEQGNKFLNLSRKTLLKTVSQLVPHEQLTSDSEYENNH